MTVPVYRVERSTCMGCGFEQRCRHRVADGVIVTPDTCGSCGRRDAWVAVPVLEEPTDVVRRRTVFYRPVIGATIFRNVAAFS